ncbi:MAG: hypothetical protein J6M22_05575, partial [Firmicutes bacterium]|nr:hypothetical protein [Bacillota bacterium]
VVQDGSSVLFEAPANETAQLTDWVSLGKFKSGAEVTLDVTLTVPIELGNEFQDRLIGALDWQFKVIETPVPEDATQTGDDFNFMIPAVVMAAALAAILFAIMGKRRKQEAE